MALCAVAAVFQGYADKVEIAEARQPNANALSAFVNMPDVALELLPNDTRRDMASYIEADSVWQAPNVMGGVSSITEASDDFVEVKVSPVSTLQIRKLPFKGGHIFMTVYTVGADRQAPDSQVSFYTSAMESLPTDKFFKLPDLAEFLVIPKGSKENFKSLSQLVAFPTYDFSASPEDTALKGKLSVGAFMTDEDFAELKPYIREQGVTYVWTGKEYKILK